MAGGFGEVPRREAPPGRVSRLLVVLLIVTIVVIVVKVITGIIVIIEW